jgi:hypothetical protein
LVWFGDATIRITRKGKVRDIGLAQTQMASLAGRTIMVNIMESLIPEPLFFRVSSQDGERIYRELCYHYPEQMQPYLGLFANSPSVLRDPSRPI